MRGFGLLGAIVAVAGIADSLVAAPNAAQRREMSSIRRELLKVPGLLRRRMGDEARKTVEAAEGRLKKLLDADATLGRDRSLLVIKRLLETEKLRVRRALGKGAAKPRAAPGSPRGKFPFGGKSPMEELLRKAREAEVARWKRDLGYWTRIVGGAKPQAVGERERALFHVGVVNVELKQWDAAKAAFETLVKEFPSGPWVISARCRLIDLAVEHDLDFETANKELATLFKWAWDKDVVWQRAEAAKRKADAERAKSKGKDARAKPASGARPPVKTSEPRKLEIRKSPSRSSATKVVTEKPAVPSIIIPTPTDKRSVAEVYWRWSLVKFVQGGVGYAKSSLPRAMVLTGPRDPRKRLTADEQMRMLMLSHAFRNWPLTPLALWKSKKPLYPYIALAELLLNSQDRERAREYVTAVLNRKRSELTEFQTSYLHYLRGQCSNGIRFRAERVKAAADFLAAQKIDPKAPWADRCLYLAGNSRWNNERDGQAAIALWQRLKTEYPKSREWDRSAYYIGVIHQQEKRYAEAKTAYDSLLKDRPKTQFVKLIKDKMKTVDRELARGAVP